MKKNKNVYVIIGLVLIATVNLIAVLNIDADFILTSGNTEALAYNEDGGNLDGGMNYK